jgi:hypothetical protein
MFFLQIIMKRRHRHCCCRLLNASRDMETSPTNHIQSSSCTLFNRVVSLQGVIHLRHGARSLWPRRVSAMVRCGSDCTGKEGILYLPPGDLRRSSEPIRLSGSPESLWGAFGYELCSSESSRWRVASPSLEAYCQASSTTGTASTGTDSRRRLPCHSIPLLVEISVRLSVVQTIKRLSNNPLFNSV